MINYNVLYIIIEKLDTKTLFNLNKIKYFQNCTHEECNKRHRASFVLQKFYRNQVKKYIKNKNIYNFGLYGNYRPSGCINFS